jgi:hypothetical protein
VSILRILEEEGRLEEEEVEESRTKRSKNIKRLSVSFGCASCYYFDG